MELKSAKQGASYASSDGSNRTFMELKYLTESSPQVPSLCSNRTFMELKYQFASVFVTHSRVLIVPLWN